MDDAQGTLALVIPILAIAGWLLYAIVSVVMRSRVRELEVRERIAMIEKGLVPPPERDPAGFQRAMPPQGGVGGHAQYRAYKHRSAGITMIAVGAGLIVMMYPNYRVGAFLIIVGVGFILSGLLDRPAGNSQL
jgi:hypothetical protein